MLAANIPVKIPTIFASSAPGGNVTAPFPNTSQPNGLASWPTGFVPSNFSAIAAGGIPPWGKDFNGLFQIVSAWLQWTQAGGTPVAYDSSFQTTIGGYPNGAMVASAVNLGLFWISTVDNNTTNPDTGGAGWFAFPYNRGGLLIASTQTFTVPAHVYAFHYRLWGGGGGGGGSASNGAGAGGNGGAYSEGWVTNTTPGAQFDIIVGTGGAAGPSGDMAGGTGGQTSIAVHSSAIFAYAQGGGGGNGGGSGSGGSTGATGVSAGGSLNLQGFTGQPGSVLSGSFALGGTGGGAAGGSTPNFSAICTDVADPLPGETGGFPGGAGSGGSSLSGNVPGGAGGAGACMLDW